MVVFDFFVVEKWIYFIFSTIEWHKVTCTQKTLCHLNK